jgi:hypothetical protein
LNVVTALRIAVLLLCAATTVASEPAPATRPVRQAQGGPSLLDRTDIFPIAVWLQSPSNAVRYKSIGINTYVGLWRGPTADQLAAFESNGLCVICAQNAVALDPRWKSVVIGFLQNDEPDNAQSLGRGKGYGPPVPAEKVIERYQAMKAADPRPVLLNLGQAVAWDDYIGRGVRRRHPEDYVQYVKGGDIVSFDIYPAVHEDRQVAGRLEFVARGTQRLVEWTEGRKPVWACIGCTHISNPRAKPTPAQVKAEVWLALIHGARGITYFAHQFQPKFIEAGLLADEEMCSAVRQINTQIQELAPALLDKQAPQKPAEITSPVDSNAVALMTRRAGGKTFVFAVGMTGQEVTAHIHLAGAAGEVTVLGEQRAVRVSDEGWADSFKGYEVHLYALGGVR